MATNATPGGIHDAWSVAFTNVQDAIDAAGDNDRIYIAGHRFAFPDQLMFVNLSGVTISGGYAATNDASLPARTMQSNGQRSSQEARPMCGYRTEHSVSPNKSG